MRDASGKPVLGEDACGAAGEGLAALQKTLRALAGGQIPVTLPAGMDCHKEVSDLLHYLAEVRSYIQSISRGEMLAPLKYRGPLAGALKSLQANLRHLTWQTKVIAEGDFSQHVDFMGEFSDAFNLMVDNLREARTQLVEKNEELQRLNWEMQQDLVLAREVQSATMNFLTKLPYLQSAVIFRPYAEVSGDFFDEYVSTEDEAFSLFVGDATGHGVSAALVTMMVKMALSSLPRGLKTDEVLRQLNRVLKPCLPIGKFLTGIFLRISPDGWASSCNAAHPPALVIPRDGAAALVLDHRGMPLGISSHEYVPFEEHRHPLQPGDRLFLYSDGLTDCRRAGERFGIARLTAFLEQNRSLDLEVLLDKLLVELTAFSGQVRFQDDLTLIGFQYLG